MEFKRNYSFAFILALVLVSLQSQATDCTATTQTFSKSFSPSSISVGRNTTVGTVISSLTNVTGGNAEINCTPGKKWMMLRYGNAMTMDSGAGIAAGTYKTNINGIGIVVKETMAGTNNFILSSELQQWYSLPSISGAHYITGLDISLVVTDQVSPGTIVFPDNFIESWAGLSTTNINDAARYNVINLNNIVIKVKACETPNIKVDLEKHNTAEFLGINSTSAAKQFNFEIKNCDPELNSVSYTFKPAAGITLENNGTVNQYLTLSSDSDATGVGVQVLYDDGTIVPFNSKIKYTGYKSAVGGNYMIPMKARYIKTASTMTGGMANSAVEFTMTYE